MSARFTTVHRLAAAVTIAALTACGGGSSTSKAGIVPAAPAAPSAPQKAVGAPATATFQIAVPAARAASATVRNAQYVSPNTQSIKIETFNPDGTTPSPAIAPAIAQLSASSSNCRAGATAGTLACNVSVPVAAGAYQFRLTVYASTDASGAALGVATVNATIAAGALNTIPVTLGGIIATLAFAQTRVSVPADGTSHPLTLSLTAKDASGAVIIAPGSFYAGIAVTKSTDPNNALTINTPAVGTPSAIGTNAIGVTYDAAKTLVSGTITATASSVTGTAAITPLTYALQSGTLIAGSSTSTRTLTVSEAGTSGPFTATAAPSSAVQISGGGSATAATPGANATFTLNGGSTAGSATITIGDGTSTGTITVGVTGTVAGVNVPAQPTVSEFVADGLNPQSGPNDITNGPDGNLWYVDTLGQDIGTMSTSGSRLQNTVVPSIGSGYSPFRITSGPDGNLWFTENDAHQNSKIGRVTPTIPSTITEYTVPTPGAHTIGIKSGPDGNIWFTEEDTNKIGKIVPSTGVITEYPGATSPRDLVAGPDGALWFTEFNYKVNPAVRKIGRITTGGTVTEFPVDTANPTALAPQQPASITVGADQKLWFTEYDPNGVSHTVDVGRMTTAGAVTIFSAGITLGSNPDGIKLLRDGNAWFTESDNPNPPSPLSSFSRIARITPLGTVTEFSQGITQNGTAAGLTSGSDGNVWFTEYGINKIGRLQF